MNVTKDFMLDRLAETTVDDMPVIFIPSWKRPKFELSRRILPSFNKAALERVFVVVRDEQLCEYKRENKNLQFIPIPNGKVTGLGSTRNFILRHAIGKRLPFIMDIDDDITSVCFLFNRKVGGKYASAMNKVEEREKDPQLYQRIFQLLGKITREIFERHPSAVLGNFRRVHMSHNVHYAQTKYQLNSGPTPRQTKIINMRMVEKYKLVIPDTFDIHGEDIGFAAEVLQHGFSCFNIPCICYDFVDAAINSVVRDPKNPNSAENRALHKGEYDALQKMDVRHYLRESFKFPDGQYMFGDVDWRKYHKLYGTKPFHWRWS